MLSIVGDNKSNAFTVTLGGNASIMGLNGTTINGNPAFITDPAVHTIKIDLGNGDDFMSANRGSPLRTVIQAVIIETGNGNDMLELTNARFNVGLNVNTGNGNDSIALAGSVSGSGNIVIDGDKGFDLLSGIGSLSNTGTRLIVDVEATA